MVWQDAVWDRTQQDVAQKARKGTLCAQDLNRIEANTAFLMELYGREYRPLVWQDGDFLYVWNVEAVLTQLQLLKDGFYAFTEGFMPRCVPGVPLMPMNRWEHWNQAERIQYELHRIWRQGNDNMPYAGDGWFIDGQIGVL